MANQAAAVLLPSLFSDGARAAVLRKRDQHETYGILLFWVDLLIYFIVSHVISGIMYG